MGLLISYFDCKQPHMATVLSSRGLAAPAQPHLPRTRTSWGGGKLSAPGSMRDTEPPEKMGNQNWDAGNPRRAQLPHLMTLGESNAALMDAGAMSQGTHIRASRRTTIS